MGCFTRLVLGLKVDDSGMVSKKKVSFCRVCVIITASATPGEALSTGERLHFGLWQ